MDHKLEPRPLRRASFSPDNKTVLFARNHNLCPGTSSESVDILELNREEQKTGKTTR